ncbi:MAG: heme-binding domain-containing protein [Sulfurovaceae bacterium]|nr:heme-binding domain-containing protein [Sulfurovaceae bacterium]MDD5548096.1 heme-binding domain-containing protein [Sulfurovaceae bacterium]
MKFWISFLIFFLAIQFIVVECKSNITSNPKDEIIAPTNIKEILKRSCYDCHSNNSIIPWYGNVAPISWYVRSHINDGRKVLNFSTFNTLPKDKQQKKYEKIEESIVIRMPLSTYLWIHSDAKLSDEDKKILKEWSKEEQKNIVLKSN